MSGVVPTSLQSIIIKFLADLIKQGLVDLESIMDLLEKDKWSIPTAFRSKLVSAIAQRSIAERTLKAMGAGLLYIEEYTERQVLKWDKRIKIGLDIDVKLKVIEVQMKKAKGSMSSSQIAEINKIVDLQADVAKLIAAYGKSLKKFEEIRKKLKITLQYIETLQQKHDFPQLETLWTTLVKVHNQIDTLIHELEEKLSGILMDILDFIAFAKAYVKSNKPEK